jgi:hypothetical protein
MSSHFARLCVSAPSRRPSVRQPRIACLTIGLVVCGLLCVYAGAYYANVRLIPLNAEGRGPWRKFPAYQHGGAAARSFFAPAAWVDRHVRRNAWYHDGDARDFVYPDDFDPNTPLH